MATFWDYMIDKKIGLENLIHKKESSDNAVS